MELRKFIKTTLREYLNEMKIYQGHKIPTDDVFYHDNPHKNHYNSELLKHIDVFISDKSFQQNPIEWVDVKNIVPTQKFLNKDNLDDVPNIKNTGAYLVKYNNLYYIIDGHHRIAKQIINGVDKVKAFVQSV